ncbi:MAG: nitrogen fixation protein [Rhodospirillales bacterium]|nr:nitrogen fixation protein [Rhodospirillales bacterium]
MRFAISSQNFMTITRHAGKTRRWIIFEANDGAAPVEVERLQLPEDMAIHNFADDGPHPLYDVDVVIVGSCGEGFVRRMACHGVVAVPTEIKDPVLAIRSYLSGDLQGPESRTLH